MKNLLEYKGFSGSVEMSIEDDCIFGTIQCINDLITYEADTIPGLKLAFEESVDDYLETCKEIGKSPDKPMSGSLNVRIGQELHKKAFLRSKDLSTSINEVIKTALDQFLLPAPKQQIHFHITSEPTSHHFNYGSSEYLAALETKKFNKPSMTH